MKLAVRFVVAISCFFILNNTAFGVGADLYYVNNLIDNASESKILNEIEMRYVEAFRKSPDRFKSSTVITLNRSSFASEIINIAMPHEGKKYQFTGRQKHIDGTNDTVWTGKDKNGATFVLADDAHGTSGILFDTNRTYNIYSLPGKRFSVIVENVPHAMQEPTPDGSAGFLPKK